MVGEITGEIPEVIQVPPQELLYQFHAAPVPKLPPVILNVLVAPVHKVDGVAIAEVAVVDTVLTETITDKHVVVLQDPEALT